MFTNRKSLHPQYAVLFLFLVIATCFLVVTALIGAWRQENSGRLLHQPTPCPTSLEHIREDVEAAAYFENGVSLSDKNLAILVEEFCSLMAARDAMVAKYLAGETAGILTYGEKFAQVQGTAKSLGYLKEALRGDPPNSTQTLTFLVMLAKIQQVQPVGLIWIRCEDDYVPEDAECWSVPETTHDGLVIVAEIYGDFSYLQVDGEDFSFTRSCASISWADAEELWHCPITVISWHPGGIAGDSFCQNMRGVWSEAGAVRFWYDSEGPYCGPNYSSPDQPVPDQELPEPFGMKA